MSNGFLYVLFSKADSQVVKLNQYFNVVERTDDECSEHFHEAYGMLVTAENIFVWSKKYAYICVLDLNLQFCYSIDLKKFDKQKFYPIAVAVFQKIYIYFIITTNDAIGLFEIKNREATMIDIHNMNIGEESVLRGICASDRYIYVAQQNRKNEREYQENDYDKGRLLCFKIVEGKLIYVCEDNNLSVNCSEKCPRRCGPCVIFYHNDAIFYSQGSYGKLFHIVKATHKPGEHIISTKLFDVC